MPDRTVWGESASWVFGGWTPLIPVAACPEGKRRYAKTVVFSIKHQSSLRRSTFSNECRLIRVDRRSTASTVHNLIIKFLPARCPFF